MFAQQRLVDDAVDAGADCLHPFQLIGVLENFAIAQMRPERHEASAGYERLGLGKRVGDIDRQVRKSRPHAHS